MTQKKAPYTFTQRLYDQRSVLHRMKEIIALPFFILISAVVSILIMTLICVPILTLVLTQPELFTTIVARGIVLLFVLYLLLRIVSSIVFYVKTGLPVHVILLSFLRGRLSAFFLFLFSLIIIAGLAAVLIFLFQYNSKFIAYMFQ